MAEQKTPIYAIWKNGAHCLIEDIKHFDPKVFHRDKSHKIVDCYTPKSVLEAWIGLRKAVQFLAKIKP